MKFITGITNGKPEGLQQFFEMCKFYEGKKVDLIIQRHSEKRSIPQNKYWFGVVLKYIKNFANSEGYDFTEDDWHEYYVSKGYFGYTDGIGGRRPKRSHEATTLEFKEAIEKIQREWAEKNLVIPDPNQSDFLQEN